MKNSYVFYFPYRGFGGVPILFLRVAEKLAELGFTCSVVDFEDGYMAKNRSDKINLITYNESQIQIPDNSILVLQSDLPWGIPSHLKSKNTTVFFWNCYPFNFVPVPPAPLSHYVTAKIWMIKYLLLTLMRGARNKTLGLIEDALSQEALAFMDGANYDVTKYALSYPVVTEKYLPVLVKPTTELQSQNLLNPKSLTVGWVGRIADFKINSLYRFIADFAEASLPVQKKMIIVGDGKYLNELKAFCQNKTSIEFEFINFINSNEIPQFLNQRLDVLCAMGTAALEGGLAKTPTLLLDFSYSEIAKGYQYRFLHETQFFNLGRPVNSTMIESKSNLNEKLQLIISDKPGQAQKCYTYVIHNHSVDEKTGYFVKLSQNSRLSYNRLTSRTYLQKPWLYQLRAKILKLFNLK